MARIPPREVEKRGAGKLCDKVAPIHFRVVSAAAVIARARPAAAVTAAHAASASAVKSPASAHAAAVKAAHTAAHGRAAEMASDPPAKRAAQVTANDAAKRAARCAASGRQAQRPACLQACRCNRRQTSLGRGRRPSRSSRSRRPSPCPRPRRSRTNTSQDPPSRSCTSNNSDPRRRIARVQQARCSQTESAQAPGRRSLLPPHSRATVQTPLRQRVKSRNDATWSSSSKVKRLAGHLPAPGVPEWSLLGQRHELFQNLQSDVRANLHRLIIGAFDVHHRVAILENDVRASGRGCFCRRRRRGRRGGRASEPERGPRLSALQTRGPK